MASSALDFPWTSSIIESFDQSFDIHIEEGNSSETLNISDNTKSLVHYNTNVPKPPPPPPSKSCPKTNIGIANSSCVPKETQDIWDKLFKQGYGADVHIISEDGLIIAAHQSILSVASPVLENYLKQSKVKNGIRYIKIPGVPYGALYAFIRFIYSSCYEEEEIKKYILHLLVLSHSYGVPSLKRFCENLLENGWLTKENVIDVLQLARNCDAPRLAMVSLHMVVKDFKSISSTEGWKVMKRANPLLEQELLEVPGGCVHCKRMWQLLELHSRMCDDPDYCKVPLCRHFKVKMQRQSKKDEAKWNLLVSKVIAAKNTQKLFSFQRSSF
ncbi:hypothetical protein ACJIZ3_017243 [Penstemon smallii]|uniref:BTB domain-containing protein n=1 Tax=Penstemon smallii TaxID=265156 RepID=A0ABD3SUZ6_9LAMI